MLAEEGESIPNLIAVPVRPRPAQRKVLEYRAGPWASVRCPAAARPSPSACLPNTWSRRLTSEGKLDDREVLVVTFTNSAVENFRSRIADFLRQNSLLPGVGYRVRTLHGLAHDIVRERPGLVGLSEDFDIVDERTASDIKRDAVLAYLRSHPDVFSPFIQPDFLQNFRRIERYVQDDADRDCQCRHPHSQGKRHRTTSVRNRVCDASRAPGLCSNLACRSMPITSAASTFAALSTLTISSCFALRALDAAPDYLARLQQRWPFILEDEAQDSSLLQEKMLRTLTARTRQLGTCGRP